MLENDVCGVNIRFEQTCLSLSRVHTYRFWRKDKNNTLTTHIHIHMKEETWPHAVSSTVGMRVFPYISSLQP